MDVINRLKSDKTILLGSILFVIGVLSGVVSDVFWYFITWGQDSGAWVKIIIKRLPTILPTLLFLLHTLSFYKTEKKSKLFVAAYVVLLAENISMLLIGVIGGVRGYSMNIFILIECMVHIICYAVMVYTSLRGIKNIKIVKGAVLVPLALTLFLFIDEFAYILDDVEILGMNYLYSEIFNFIGPIAIHIALFVVVSDTIKVKKDLVSEEVVSFESTLVTIKKQYEAGEITEEEYNVKKKEILNNL